MRQLVQVVARLEAPWIPCDALHLRLLEQESPDQHLAHASQHRHAGQHDNDNVASEHNDLFAVKEEEGFSGGGGGGGGVYVGEQRNRNWKYNLVYLSNTVSVKPAYTPLLRTFEVVLSFALAPDSRALVFQVCQGYGPQGSIAPAASVLGITHVDARALAESGRVDLEVWWSAEAVARVNPQQNLAAGANPTTMGRLVLSVLQVPVWQQLCGTTLAKYAGRLLQHPSARTLVVSALSSSIPVPYREEEENQVIASEIAFETMLTFSVPTQLLRLRLARLVEYCQRWEKLYSAVRIANCHFSSDHLAAKHGYERVKLTILGARHLSQTQHSQQANGDGTKRKSNAFSGALRGMMQTAQKRMDASGMGQPLQTGPSSSSSSSSSQKLCNPFVRVSYQHPAGHRVVVGRTTAEHRTMDPVFKTCLLENEFASLEGPNTLSFYVPSTPDVLVMFEVFHERNSTLTQRTTNVPMMEACYPLGALLAMQAKASAAGLAHAALNLCPHGTQTPVLGTLQVATQSTRDKSDPMAHARDATFVPGNPFYFQWGVRWMDTFVQHMHEDVVTLNQLLKACQDSEEAVANELRAGTLVTSCMKQSVCKKDFHVGAMPTNLHANFWVCQFEFQCELSCSWRTCVSRSSPSITTTTAAAASLPTSVSAKTCCGGPTKFFKTSIKSTTKTCKASTSFGDEAASIHKRSVNSCRELHKASPQEWTPGSPEALPLVNVTNEDAKVVTEQWQHLANAWRKHFLRESVVLSQALSSLVTCFVTELAVRLSGSDIAVHHVSQWAESGAIGGLWVRQLYEIGFLVGWESLVSAQGKELGMLEDAIAGLEALEKSTRFHIIPYEDMPSCGFAKSASEALLLRQECQIYVHVSDGADASRSPRGAGSGDANDRQQASEIQVYIAVPRQEYETLVAPVTSEKLMRGIRVVPVLFTQGINETQTLANLTTFLTDTAGSTRQLDLNHASLRRVERYLESYREWLRLCGYGVGRGGEPETLRLAAESLQRAVHAQQRAAKDVQVLISAENAVRALNGGRITFCKSGKDRTAMSMTLEQTRLLRATPLPGNRSLEHLDDQVMANLMREYGGRIVVAEKNVGRPKYSFNAAQRQLLPSIYRPPTTTIQDFYTSVLARDS
ncbi:Type II inositol 3,4-bisphosphate 4-phosphatase [Hondaea fermentalgiana]|uniref:Type II inositol 3,4-bisphosphate 4-phosphatase n=1 Tax=Hondaea fermentalgiana TaxID=2315210 RepID=A0A2R5GWM3_9STRA|nr:Type II inositol 3,4-bisphosphate 4-phosphatase [Hondaea fermentalgiana]|eukprot:GBG33063.1 Type II inositol 3,4-bisphosphate 4-phosphatase [Hondaea fermentalgiana]